MFARSLVLATVAAFVTALFFAGTSSAAMAQGNLDLSRDYLIEVSLPNPSRSLLVTSQLTLPLVAVQPVGLHRHGSLLPRVPLPVRQLRRRDQPAPPTRLRV